MDNTPIIFISGAYRAGTECEVHKNCRLADRVARIFWRNGFYVFCPHNNTFMMGGLCPDDNFLNGCVEMLRRFCKCGPTVLLRLPFSDSSHGAKYEWEAGQRFGAKMIWLESDSDEALDAALEQIQLSTGRI